MKISFHWLRVFGLGFGLEPYAIADYIETSSEWVYIRDHGEACLRRFVHAKIYIGILLVNIDMALWRIR